MAEITDLFQPTPAGGNPLPAELLGQTPRRVRMTGTSLINIVAAILFISVGVAIGVRVMKEEIQQRNIRSALRQGGVESQGQITEKWTQGRSSVPYVSYVFAANGNFYYGKSSVSKETYRKLNKFDSLPILYLPADPNISHPADWEDSTYSMVVVFLVPGMFAVLGVMFVRRMPGQRRLAREGIGAHGSVTECRGPSKSGYFIDYTFKNRDTGELEIGSCPSDGAREVGSNVWVLYLPANPSRSEIYPFSVDFYRIIP